MKKTSSGYEENVDGSNTKESNTKEKVGRAQFGTFIDLDFQPNPDTITRLKINGHKPLSKDELLTFVLNYKANGFLRNDWDAMYQKWVINQRRHYDKKYQTNDREYSLDDLGDAFVNGD